MKGVKNMSDQMIFKRYELKYMLTQEQKAKIEQLMASYMALDPHGEATIRNIYFDTSNYRLIRHSIEHPAYKEKLRIRSYQKVEANDSVFVELKKKYDSIVYKRRMVLPERQAMDCLCNGIPIPEESQIAQEINYFCSYYEDLMPAVFLSYHREAFYAVDGSDFRITFDNQILYRQNAISLTKDIFGTPLLDSTMSLMEIKTSGGIPLWMTAFLSENKIFKTSFSKYGAAYKKIMQEQTKGGVLYA